jgi:GT2 family glycosyltransferase
VAERFLEKELFRFPTDEALRQLYLEACRKTHPPEQLAKKLQALALPTADTRSEAPFMPEQPDTIETDNTIDVLEPVYKGQKDTLDCLHSLIQYQADNQTPHQIIVLDDASPEGNLVNALQRLARKGQITYIRREQNLGFIKNMNRGMALHPARDVVWLNADTRVHGNWLDRLKAAAYSHDQIASATPFSNNGELMSFPVMRQQAPMPTPEQHALLDQTAAELKNAPIDIPLGCGFCFYLKRAAINDVGYLDEVALQRGYGEETDWCARATAKGWRHAGATNVFVAHRGGSSFGAEKALRVQQNNAVIRQRYPTLEKRFDRFVQQDPLKPARDALAAKLPKELAQPAPAKAPPAQLTANALSFSELLHHSNPIWLIADPLDNEADGNAWLTLARSLRRANPQAQLLLAQKTSWQIELSRTGCVTHLPELPHIKAEALLTLCGARQALTLNNAPASQAVASQYQLSLCHVNAH